VSQVKQKMATLRIYVVDDSPTAEVLEVLRAARDESIRTCEDCGGAGSLRSGSGWATLCGDCFGLRQRGHGAGTDHR
jgi:hypothetical protein